LPGDDVTPIIQQALQEEGGKYVVGPGLLREASKTVATTAGILKMREKPIVFWVQHNQRKYFPVNGERVVGTVVSVTGFNSKIDIGSADLITLNLLAFEGATKRNRPNMNVGDVVFARVVSPARDVEPELVCITSALKRDGMGVLTPPTGHYAQLVSVSVHTSRKLLSPSSQLLKLLGMKYRFETAVGMNGRVWISSKSPESVIFIGNAIARSESWSPDEETQFYDDLRGNVDFTLIDNKRKNKKGKKV